MPTAAMPATIHPPVKRDLLLAAAKVFLAFLIAVLIFAMAMVAIGVVVLTVGRSELLGDIVAADAPAYAYWLVVLLLLLIAGTLFLAMRFVSELRRIVLSGIVLSVEEGDPFHPDNARRLARMGWLALAIWLAGIPFSLIAALIAPYVGAAGNHMSVEIELGVQNGFAALFLILTLFILARVFRQGAAMRDELEGTI